VRIPMKLWTVAACAVAAVVLAIGCNATSRYETLSFFFDGVPTPMPTPGPEGQPPKAGAQAVQVRYREHGPYAARMCNACHDPAALNVIVVPIDQLCSRCHEIKLDKKYIHGPLASGGCTACHDPHSSQYRYFLVSEADTFCTYCHNPQALERVAAHQGTDKQCTACHDAHMSDKKYLLK
jgi:predicted CXXCH cytochrome family protein